MKVLVTREQKDGSLLIDIDYTKEDKRAIKFITGCKRLTKKGIQKFCEQAIREYVEKVGDKN